MTRTLQPCGTYAAYRRHLRHQEPPDDACRAAGTAGRAKYKRPPHPRQPGEARCGTLAGWSRHQNRGETPCPACCTRKAEYDKRRREAPQHARTARLNARAQGKALGELARRHHDEYRALYAEHKAKLLAEATD